MAFAEHHLFHRLLAELKAELDELEAARRPGRPPSNREDLLKNTLHRERDEFKTGYGKLIVDGLLAGRPQLVQPTGSYVCG